MSVECVDCWACVCVCVEKVDVVWDTVLVPVVMYRCVTWTTTSYLCARIVASDTSAHRIILRRMFCCCFNGYASQHYSVPVPSQDKLGERAFGVKMGE